ncbi:hypothetical protein [Cellulomonas cellasea]|uniref:Uncharacterized protein n=1 Tax=Cellulomonas cellasea TaxID=43670 RepID=A0A7W4UJY6_9CELL|nr:hypothetical protein [Cellulomonas cellasea]MBB2925543.1 hypothetical protein [Cellulomonas cellasea]
MDEALDGALRMGLTVAGQVGERIARWLEQQAREAQARSEQAARELAERMGAERAAARAELVVVGRDEWWARAKPEEVARVWEVANTWSRFDPDAARALETIREQVRDRYGINSATPGTSAQQPAQAVDADRARAAARLDEATAVRILTDVDPGNDERGLDLYDSAERRNALASDLERAGVDGEAVEARVLADKGQGAPAHAAVSSPARKGAGSSKRARGPRTAERTLGR